MASLPFALARIPGWTLLSGSLAACLAERLLARSEAGPSSAWPSVGLTLSGSAATNANMQRGCMQWDGPEQVTAETQHGMLLGRGDPRTRRGKVGKPAHCRPSSPPVLARIAVNDSLSSMATGCVHTKSYNAYIERPLQSCLSNHCTITALFTGAGCACICTCVADPCLLAACRGSMGHSASRGPENRRSWRSRHQQPTSGLWPSLILRSRQPQQQYQPPSRLTRSCWSRIELWRRKGHVSPSSGAP